MSDADLAKVSAWLKSQGLTVDGYSRARTRVFFSGTASQVEGAFRTEFHRYLVDGQTSFANATELRCPGHFPASCWVSAVSTTFAPAPGPVLL